MAYIQGNPVDGLKQTVTRHLFLMGVVTLLLGGIMTWTSENPAEELLTIVAITFACAGLIALVSLRANPLALTMLLKPGAFQKAVNEENRVQEILEKLPDDCFIFNNLILELFRVDHLILSTRGIFVIGRVRRAGALRIEEGQLFAGEHSQKNITSSTWRICHLLNIVIRKGWSKEVMPSPVVVGKPWAEQLKGASFVVDGIRVSDLESLTDHIQASPPGVLDEELVESVASYILRRYTRA